MATKTPKRRTLRPAEKQTAKQHRHGSSKLDAIVTALREPKGATLTRLCALTGWQRHSVRGAISGSLKKKRKLKITSDNTGDERVYRIEGKA